MSAIAPSILTMLDVVAAERRARAGDVALSDKVSAIKRFQQARFIHTYADLLRSPRYGSAARFFLDELYGPDDFTQRDTQFARVVPSMVKLFPREVVETVADLTRLHALSETLDTEMARHATTADLSAMSYLQAWNATDRRADRELQIELTLAVAARLDKLTRKALLRNSLRLMRGPARAAGLGELQKFLEAGFDTFRTMNGAVEFISVVQVREQTFASCLFAAVRGQTNSDSRALQEALACLPGETGDLKSTASSRL